MIETTFPNHLKYIFTVHFSPKNGLLENIFILVKITFILKRIIIRGNQNSKIAEAKTEKFDFYFLRIII